MSRRLGRPPVMDDREVEALITRRSCSDEHLQRAVRLLASLASVPAPTPTPALADLLDRGFPTPATASRAPSPGPTLRRRAARIGVVLAGGLASVLVAGAAHALPPALQNGVAELVSVFSPFELPRSAPPESDPTPGAVTEITPAAPSETAPPRPSVTSTAPARTTMAPADPVEEGRPAPEPADDSPAPGPADAGGGDAAEEPHDGSGDTAEPGSPTEAEEVEGSSDTADADQVDDIDEPADGTARD